MTTNITTDKSKVPTDKSKTHTDESKAQTSKKMDIEHNANMINDIKRLQEVEKGLYVELNNLMSSANLVYEPNVYKLNNPDLMPIGGFGGVYTCPDGQSYVVGDHNNDCGRNDVNKWGHSPLAGMGGKITKNCSPWYATNKKKQGWGVVCGTKKVMSKEDLAARERILQQINDIVNIRMNLFKNIKNDYTETQQNLVVQGQDLANQKKLVEMVEDELNKVRGKVNKQSSYHDTQLRMIEVGNYQFQRYEAHKALIKVIFYCTIIILLASVLIQIDLLPSFLGSSIIAITLVVCCVIIIWKLSDMYSRSNMNYNEFEFDKPSNVDSVPVSRGETVWQHDKLAFDRVWSSAKADASSIDDHLSKDITKHTKAITKETTKDTTKTPKQTGLLSEAKTHISDEISDIMGAPGTIV